MEDTCQVYSALLAQGYDPGQIIFAGDSAGGNLVFTTLLRAKALALPMPAAAVAISPWGDLSLSGESYTHNQHRDVMLPVKSMREVVPLIVGEHNADEPQVSPIFGNFEGFPPLMIHVGDTEVLYSDALHLRDNAVRDAVPVLLHEWRDTPHVLPLFHQFMPEARACLYEMTLFMKQQYSRAIHETVEPVTH